MPVRSSEVVLGYKEGKLTAVNGKPHEWPNQVRTEGLPGSGVMLITTQPLQ